MGFSKDGRMVGSTAMVGWFNRKGQARIKESCLQVTRPSQDIEEAGELDLTKVPPAVVIHGAMIYSLSLKTLSLPSQLYWLLEPANPNHYRLSSHDDKTTILFDFTAGSMSKARINPGQMKKNHEVLGTLARGLFLPSGAIVARYLKHKEPLWYYLHAGIQFLGFLLGLANVVPGQQLGNKINARPRRDAKIYKCWKWYHHWFGRIALFFGAFNIVLGIHLGAAGMSWKVG
ncbi:cytochrome b561 and DOMON domain-containing protein [Populus alba x Populus x berolinensis]|nr:cytochrome b561 and DOMON domain-containing protein [Populus alba x Populus x berolinensis]